MARSDVIEEFLVSLGYKLDEPSERKMLESLDKGAKAVLTFGASIEAMVLIAAAAAVKVASSFEKMFYLSQESGAAAKNVTAFAYAISQVGGSTEGARGSIEGFARFLRENPGSNTFLKRLGIQTTDANGRQRDTVDMLVEVGEKLRNLSNTGRYYQAKIYAGILGIDEKTLLAFTRDFEKFGKEYEALYKKAGVNYEETARRSRDFMQQVRLLGTEFGLIKDKVFGDLETKYGPKLEQLTTWLADHMGDVADRIERIISGLIKLGDRIGDVVEKLGGWKTVGEAVLAFFAFKWALGMVAAITMVTTAMGVLVSSPAVLALLAVAGALTYVATHVADNGPSTGSPAAAGKKASSPRAQQMMDYFMKQGWTREQAAGITANAIAESGLDPHVKENAYNKGHKGLFQWDETRQRAFASIYGHGVDQGTFEEQMEFAQHELKTGERFAAWRLGMTRNPGSAAFEFGHKFERYQLGQGQDKTARQDAFRAGVAESLFRGAPVGGQDGSTANNVTLSSETHIHLEDSGDPAANGKAVAGEQGRVNASAVRQLQGAVR